MRTEVYRQCRYRSTRIFIAVNLSQTASYTWRVERQLKERLIGAAVLIAIAVVLVPEMFSGPKSRVVAPDQVTRNGAASDASTDQLKTWRVTLQDTSLAVASSSATAVVVEPPAPAPRDEVAAVSSAPSLEQSQQMVATLASSSASMSSTSAAHSESSAAPSVKPTASSSSNSRSAKSIPAKTAEAKPVESAGKWQVQVGSFGTEARAKQIAAQLKSQGQSASVSSVQSAGRTLYRVRVAAGTSREAAQAVLKKLATAYPGASVAAPDR